jgi:hypothetical protein
VELVFRHHTLLQSKVFAPFHQHGVFNIWQSHEYIILHTTRDSIFWDITLCSLLKVNRQFGGTCYLHLQGWRVSEARNKHETGSSTFNPDNEGDVFLRKVCFPYTTWYYILDIRTLHSQCCKNLKTQYCYVHWLASCVLTPICRMKG